MHDSMDWDFYGDRAELGYECVNTANNVYHTISTSNCWQSSQKVFYSDCCMSGSYLFGCVGLRNQSYCLFNRSYTSLEYEQLLSKILSHMTETGEWGEFFHPSLSPFGYNETVAMEYYPMVEKE